MGLRFRKSASFGPFRATLSKSGVSFSAGVKGARITKKANGNIMSTVGLPGTGVHYVKEVSMANKQYTKVKEKAPTQKEIEQIALAQISQEPTNFYDLIPFSDIKERTLFIIGYYAGLFNKYKEGETANLTLEELAIPFKVIDVNNAAAKVGELRAYTSNHLSKMVDKGWFIRENRGTYKINTEAIYPYAKQFKEYQEQKEKQLEQEKLARELEQVAKQKEEQERLEQQAKQKERDVIKQKILKELQKEKTLKSKKVRKTLAIIAAFLMTGPCGLPSFIVGDWKLGLLSIGIICISPESLYGLAAILTIVIIPIISIKKINRTR